MVLSSFVFVVFLPSFVFVVVLPSFVFVVVLPSFVFVSVLLSSVMVAGLLVTSPPRVGLVSVRLLSVCVCHADTAFGCASHRLL